MSGDVRLGLELAAFEEGPFLEAVERCARAGVELAPLASLGDTEPNRRRLYELNRECSADIPGRGPFPAYEEYRATRIERPAYSPEGTILALDDGEWIGMCMLSDWRDRGFMFTEMTGVVASRRRHGVATALKVTAIRFARASGAAWVYTVLDPRNVAAIALNRRLGFADVDSSAWPDTRRSDVV